MTYQIVVPHKDKKIVVRVDAHSECTATEVARWLVEHHQHLQAHAHGGKFLGSPLDVAAK